MDDEQIDVMTVLLAQHIDDIARSDMHIALILRYRLLSTECDDGPRDAIRALINDLAVPSHCVH